MKEGRQREKGKGRVEEIIKGGRVGRREERVERGVCGGWIK